MVLELSLGDAVFGDWNFLVRWLPMMMVTFLEEGCTFVRPFINEMEPSLLGWEPSLMRRGTVL